MDIFNIHVAYYFALTILFFLAVIIRLFNKMQKIKIETRKKFDALEIQQTDTLKELEAARHQNVLLTKELGEARHQNAKELEDARHQIAFLTKEKTDCEREISILKEQGMNWNQNYGGI